jgi:hypothetical protein
MGARPAERAATRPRGPRPSDGRAAAAAAPRSSRNESRAGWPAARHCARVPRPPRGRPGDEPQDARRGPACAAQTPAPPITPGRAAGGYPPNLHKGRRPETGRQTCPYESPKSEAGRGKTAPAPPDARAAPRGQLSHDEFTAGGRGRAEQGRLPQDGAMKWLRMPETRLGLKQGRLSARLLC